ncbi:octopamine receptor beta-1R-like [Oculina patagonica]
MPKNISGENIEDHFASFAKILETRSTGVAIVEISFFLLINVATLFGNLLLCAVLLKNLSFRSITNILILALSVADILMGAICMPLTCGALVQGKWIYGDFACQLQCFFIYFLAFVSLQTIVLTSLNRFYRVVKPAKYRRLFTVKKTVGALIALWLSSAIILAVPLTTGAFSATFNPAKAACVIFRKGAAMEHNSYPAILRGLLLLFFAVIPSVVIFTCYFKIFRAVGEHFTRVAPSLNVQSARLRLKSRVNSQEMRTTITLFAIVVMFVLSWLPVFVIEIIQAFAIDWWKIPREVQLLWTFFGSFSSAANPLVYGFANSSYRREYRRLLTLKWKRKSGDRRDIEGSRTPSVVMATLNLPS